MAGLAQFNFASPRVWGALAANAIPVAGVLFWGWSAGALMLLYWLENVVVGVFNALRMGVSGAAQGPAAGVGALFLIAFFLFHYGMFCAVHGVFVWTMFGQGLETLARGADPFADPLGFVGHIALATPGLRAGFAAMVVWHAAMFFVFFLGRREYRETDPMTQMSRPYGRIVVLHVTIIAGGFVVLALGQPVFAVAILSALKAAMDMGGAARVAAQDGRPQQAWRAAMAQIAALRARTPPPPPQG
ncbi:MAG: DUF6498-containing protein [Hyphomonadaceae bacterium]